MEWTVIIQYAIYPVLGLGVYLYKDLRQDVDMLKQDIHRRTTETQVRQILNDKVEPLKDSLDELKMKIEKLTEYLMNKDSN